MSFEPKILGFLCNWCSYAGADLAGVSRIQYPPNVRVIRVMCSGRVDPEFIFEALKTGLDGVIVTGCHPGDCHYLEGNYEAEMKLKLVQQLLRIINFDKRVRLEWVSASEGKKFAEVMTDFTNQIKSLGPSPLRGATPDADFLKKLNALQLAATGQRLRALVGRERKITQQENVYGEKVPMEKFDPILASAIQEEYERFSILLSLGAKPKGVKDLASVLKIDPSRVLEHIVVLRTRNQVGMDRIEGLSPIYFAMGGT